MKKFEGKPVKRARIKVTRAGDGLSKAMKVDPVELPSGSTCYVVIEAEVGPITFDPIEDGKAFERVQTLRAGVATLVDQDLVAEVLEAQRIKIEENEGILRFPDPDAPAEEDEHDDDGE